MSDNTSQPSPAAAPDSSSTQNGDLVHTPGSAPAGALTEAPATSAFLAHDEAISNLQAQMMADRWEAAAARAGIEDAYVDAALALFNATGKEATKANMMEFADALKAEKPALFGPVPAQTAPTPTQATPAAPAPGGVSNAYSQWRALVDAGRRAEAEAYYLRHRHAINRA